MPRVVEEDGRVDEMDLLCAALGLCSEIWIVVTFQLFDTTIKGFVNRIERMGFDYRQEERV